MLDVYREIRGWKKPIHASKAKLASAYLKLLPNTKIIAITGSVGKTLTQNTIYKVLSQKYACVVGDDNLDPTFRIPQTILKTKVWDKYMILEYGVEHEGDMDFYLSIAKPNIAVVTKISPTHTRYFRDVNGVYREKSKLPAAMGKNSTVFLNADDPNSKGLADITAAKVIWFGKHAKNGVKISHFSQTLRGAKYRLHYEGQKASVTTKIIGVHQLTSAFAAATVGISQKITLKQIAQGLSQVKPPDHRLNIITSKNLNAIDDTYNSSPAAASESIKALADIGKGMKKILILGEMRDLGSISEPEHKKLGEQIAKTRTNNLITIGKQAKIISDTAKKNNFFGAVKNVPSTKEATKIAKTLLSKKTLFLVKGSRHEHLERIILGLQHKSTGITCYHCGKLN